MERPSTASSFVLEPLLLDEAGPGFGVGDGGLALAVIQGATKGSEESLSIPNLLRLPAFWWTGARGAS
jgi:hypothetical protein